MIEHFTTASVAFEQRLDFWNELVGATYDGLVVDPLHAQFCANLYRWQTDNLVMIRPQSAAAAVARRRHGGTSSGAGGLVLHVLHKGQSKLWQRGREVWMTPGDAVICASDEFYQFDVAHDHEMLVVELPRASIEAVFHDVDDHVATRLPAKSGAVRILHNFLLSLWQEASAGLDDAATGAYAPIIAELSAAAMRDIHGNGADMRPRPLFSRMQAIVEARLCDPQLSVRMLAEELGVSLRTLQNAAAGEGTTPRVYLLSRRLEKGAALLRMSDNLSVKEISYQTGFTDSAYFTRCFKRHFGVPPLDYRRGH